MLKLEAPIKPEFSSCSGLNIRPLSNSPFCSTKLGPEDVGRHLRQYTVNNVQLETQLSQIENEVKSMHNELGQLQRGRQQLEQQRVRTPLGSTNQSPRETGSSNHLKELQEKYNHLQDDFKTKMAEVASLRSENIQLRLIAEEAKDANATAEAAMQSLEEKYTEMQSRLIKGTEEQMMEQEQQLTVARQRFREVQDELDDLRTLTNDQTVQLEEYRNKYLQAQEQVEELKKNIELLEMDNSHIIEQVNIELQRIKTQFQERMNELTPLPDILTATQLKLKESQQLKAIVEHNLEEMSQELQEAKEQIDALQREMVNSQTSIQIGSDEKDALKAAIENWEKKYNDLKEESSALKSNIVRLEEAAIQNQIRFQEKVHEITQLTVQLETVREESARQVTRSKCRAEAGRRALQNQISEMEKELAQCRAAARAAQKDRDEIRQRMQFQINNLTDNFDQAQLRIQNLQSHVNFLKTSYHDFYGPDLI